MIHFQPRLKSPDTLWQQVDWFETMVYHIDIGGIQKVNFKIKFKCVLKRPRLRLIYIIYNNVR